MSYTYPATITTNQRLSRDELNVALRDNMLALKNPPTAVYITGGYSADLSTTSTSFANVDANFSLTIETTGDGNGGNGDVMIGLCGTLYSSSSIRIYFRILEDGVALNTDDGLITSEGSGVRPIGLMFLRANATPASHTYVLQWKVSGGTGVLLSSAGTSTRDCKAIFFAREMS